MAKRELAGRVVAVTGGAQGIGRAVAGELARRGARVAIGDLNPDLTRQAAQELPGEVIGLTLDVTDLGSFERFLNAVEAHLGSVDVLVNNAGVMWLGAAEDEPEQATLRQLNVNVLGVIHGVKLMLPRMRARGQGHIITMASAASKLTPPGQATYTASKHAVYGYMSAVRQELVGSGIDVSVVMPGTVCTQLTTGMHTGATRWVQPAEIAGVVARLIQQPRFEVSYPGWIGTMAAWSGVLPDALRWRLARLSLPNQITAKRENQGKRAEYEAQALGVSQAQKDS